MSKFALLSPAPGLGLLASSIVALSILTTGALAQEGPSAGSFTSNFSEMGKLKSLVSQGKGKIGVLLPETTTSARYTSFDEPYLKEAYDRLTLGGDRAYYVSFDNVEVGKLIGQGMTSCIGAWNVKNPQILVMRGAPTDNNATLFAQGYMDVLKPDFASKKYTLVGEPAGTWDPATARTTFEGQYTAHPNINAVVMPNDDTANAVISYLKTIKVPPKTFPTTGQDATLTGLQNVLSGYQCGTAYKPIYLEAQAAAALGLYLRAGQKPPADLVNGSTMDSKENKNVASVLLKPIWVTPQNMASTVVKDNFVKASQLCGGDMAKDCKADGIS